MIKKLAGKISYYVVSLTIFLIGIVFIGGQIIAAIIYFLKYGTFAEVGEYSRYDMSPGYLALAILLLSSPLTIWFSFSLTNKLFKRLGIGY